MPQQEQKNEEERQFCELLLRQGRELHLALCDGDEPYLVPLNYGYAEGCLYIHSGIKGKKLDCLRKNPRVCFSVHELVSRIGGERACQWSTGFRSLIGRGTAQILTERDEKIHGYDVLMNHFGGPQGDYDEHYLQTSLIIRIKIESLSGKQSEKF